MFYIVCRNLDERTRFMAKMKELGVGAVFHYLSLHKSDYYRSVCKDIPCLPNSDKYTDCLVRLPMYYELDDENVRFVIESVKGFFENCC